MLQGTRGEGQRSYVAQAAARKAAMSLRDYPEPAKKFDTSMSKSQRNNGKSVHFSRDTLFISKGEDRSPGEFRGKSLRRTVRTNEDTIVGIVEPVYTKSIRIRTPRADRLLAKRSFITPQGNRKMSSDSRSKEDGRNDFVSSKCSLNEVGKMYPGLFGVAKIQVVNRNVNEIDRVPEQYQGASTIYLSNNSIIDLSGIEQFQQVRTLSLAHNDVVTMDSLAPLAKCQKLKYLKLAGCPISERPFYRIHVARKLPGLHFLDKKEISKQEKAESKYIVEKENQLHREMFLNHCSIFKLKRFIFQGKLRLELRTMKLGGSLGSLLLSPPTISVFPRQHMPNNMELELFLQIFRYERDVGRDVRYEIQEHLVQGVLKFWKVITHPSLDSPSANRKDKRNPDSYEIWEEAFSQMLQVQQSAVQKLKEMCEEMKVEISNVENKILAKDPEGRLVELQEEYEEAVRVSRPNSPHIHSGGELLGTHDPARIHIHRGGSIEIAYGAGGISREAPSTAQRQYHGVLSPEPQPFTLVPTPMTTAPEVASVDATESLLLNNAAITADGLSFAHENSHHVLKPAKENMPIGKPNISSKGSPAHVTIHRSGSVDVTYCTDDNGAETNDKATRIGSVGGELDNIGSSGHDGGKLDLFALASSSTYQPVDDFDPENDYYHAELIAPSAKIVVPPTPPQNTSSDTKQHQQTSSEQRVTSPSFSANIYPPHYPHEDDASHFQRVAHRLAVTQLLGAVRSGRSLYGKKLRDVQSFFAAVDRDGDGEINNEEFNCALLRLGLGLSKEQLENMTSLFEWNWEGKIDARKFEAALQEELYGDDAADVYPFEKTMPSTGNKDTSTTSKSPHVAKGNDFSPKDHEPWEETLRYTKPTTPFDETKKRQGRSKSPVLRRPTSPITPKSRKASLSPKSRKAEENQLLLASKLKEMNDRMEQLQREKDSATKRANKYENRAVEDADNALDEVWEGQAIMMHTTNLLNRAFRQWWKHLRQYKMLFKKANRFLHKKKLKRVQRAWNDWIGFVGDEKEAHVKSHRAMRARRRKLLANAFLKMHWHCRKAMAIKLSEQRENQKWQRHFKHRHFMQWTKFVKVTQKFALIKASMYYVYRLGRRCLREWQLLTVFTESERVSNELANYHFASRAYRSMFSVWKLFKDRAVLKKEEEEKKSSKGRWLQRATIVVENTERRRRHGVMRAAVATLSQAVAVGNQRKQALAIIKRLYKRKAMSIFWSRWWKFLYLDACEMREQLEAEQREKQKQMKSSFRVLSREKAAQEKEFEMQAMEWERERLVIQKRVEMMKTEMERLGLQAREKGKKTFQIYEDVKAAEQDVDSLRTEVVANREKVAFYEEEHALITSRSTDLEARLVSRDSKIQELMKMVEGLHDALKKKDLEKEKVVEKLEESLQEKQSLQNNLSSLQAAWEEDKKSLKIEIKSLKKIVKSLEAQVSIEDAATNSLKDELAQTTARAEMQNQSMEKKLASSLSMVEGLKKAVEIRNAEIAMRNAEKDIANEEVATLEVRFANETAQLNEEIEIKSLKIEELEAQVLKLTNRTVQASAKDRERDKLLKEKNTYIRTLKQGINRFSSAEHDENSASFNRINAASMIRSYSGLKIVDPLKKHQARSMHADVVDSASEAEGAAGTFDIAKSNSHSGNLVTSKIDPFAEEEEIVHQRLLAMRERVNKRLKSLEQ